MSKSKSTMRVVLLVATMSWVGFSFADDIRPDDRRYIYSYTCKDIMKLPLDSRLVAFSFLHGYILGTEKTKTFSLKRLDSSLEVFSKDCLAQPRKTAANVMDKSVAVAKAEPFPEFEDYVVYEDYRDFNTYKCMDVMKLWGRKKKMALSILHGYFLGKRQIENFSLNRLNNSFKKFTQYCLDHPKDIAVNVMAGVSIN